MSLDNYRLILRQYTIENIEKEGYLNNKKGTYIHIYHKWGYHVFHFLYEDELNLLLSLLQCEKEKLTLKKVIGVELFGENVAIGYNNKYILFRDLYVNNSNKLLSLDELCRVLEIFNYTALDDNDKVMDINVLLMECKCETKSNNVKILRR